MPIRSALDFATARLIVARWKNASLLELRTISVIVLQRATGCRGNELNPFTLKQFKDLVKTKVTEIFNSKLNHFKIKVISESSAPTYLLCYLLLALS